MDELTFYLEKTKPKDFVTWLEAYSQKMRIAAKEYPYQPGINVAMIYYDIGAKEAKIGAVADRSYLKKIDNDNEILEFEPVLQIDNAIVITWLKVGERLKVAVQHYGARWVISPVFELLAEISRDWNQTRGDIWKIIQEHSQKYHIDLSTPTANQPRQADATKQEMHSSGKKEYNPRRLRLLHVSAIEFLDWVKETFLLPKPEITYSEENKKAKIVIKSEEFAYQLLCHLL